MLSVRLTEQFCAAYSLDPSLIETLTDKEIRDYRATRNYTDIQEQLAKASAAPTLFYCVPLKVDYEHFVDQVSMNGLESEAAWRIFRHHVTKIDNFGKTLRRDKDDAIHDDCREWFPRDVVSEIALVITEKANADTRGFTLPRTFSEQLIRARLAQRLVCGAKSASASETENGTL
jgi:hypothetical protein